MPRPRGQNELLRLLTLIPYLNQRQGQTIGELAAELGISRAELLDDLQRLSLYGNHPYGPADLIMAVVDDGGRLEMTSAEQFRSSLHLNAGEVAALRVALMPFAEMGRYSGTVKSIIGKLEAALLPKERVAFERLDRRLVVKTIDKATQVVLTMLDQAKARLQPVEILYFTGSNEQLHSRVIEPYGFVLFAGQWYVVARCRRAREVRVFKANRIREIRMVEGKYRVPAGFAIGRYARGGVLFQPRGTEQEVKIWFSPKIAPYILERSCNAVRKKDGSALLTVMANNFTWIARWVLQYGKEARILTPSQAVDDLYRIVSQGEGKLRFASGVKA